jgi:hypothetical protein
MAHYHEPKHPGKDWAYLSWEAKVHETSWPCSFVIFLTMKIYERAGNFNWTLHLFRHSKISYIQAESDGTSIWNVECWYSQYQRTDGLCTRGCACVGFAVLPVQITKVLLVCAGWKLVILEFQKSDTRVRRNSLYFAYLCFFDHVLVNS